MPQGTSCLIGAMGLHEHEVRLVKSMLRHSNDRDLMRYEWTDNLNEAHVAMVSSDNEAAMKAWQILARKHSNQILLLVTPKMLHGSTEYYVSRPFSPARILIVLDKIFREKFATNLEPEIFSGDAGSVQSKNTQKAQVVALTARLALVVDDSPTARKQLELELGSYGVGVNTAESGEQCLAMLEGGHYDIIFLDVVMPGADGYEVCKKIRKNQIAKRTPVIMLTSKSASFDRVRGALAGCSAYLTKPVDYEKFRKVLDEYLAPIQDMGTGGVRVEK